MGDQYTFLAKLSLPVLPPIIERQRLYALLDAEGTQVSWISALAGSGKSTLATGFARAKGLKTIWYQIDSGDEDPSSFFYHLNLASKQANPRRKKQLPALTPEYILGLEVFARNFFRDFFASFKVPLLLILDNYHELKPDSMMHGLVRLLLSELPPNVRIIVTSRELPPSIFADLRAKQRLQVLEWDDLRLNEAECANLADLNASWKADDATCSQLYRMSDGWMAGVILMLNASGRQRYADKLLNPESLGVIADYFESEVLSRLDEKQKALLLRTSILPTVTTEIAEALTGFKDAYRMLDTLYQTQCFVERRGSKRPTYQYHHLFRDFLRQRLKDSMSDSDICGLYGTAATLFEQTDHIEYAAGLYQKAESWDALGKLCCEHGKQMMETGRLNTLSGWLTSIPEKNRIDNPWLLFWLGQCRKSFEPGAARDLFQSACELFDRAGDGTSAYLAWSAAVETYLGEWNEFRSIRKWLKLFDGLYKKYPDPGSLEAEASIAISMFVAVSTYRPMPKNIGNWEKKCLQLIPSMPTVEQRILLTTMMSFYWSKVGEIHRATTFTQQFSTEVDHPAVSPFIKILWGWNQCVLLWLSGKFEEYFHTYAQTLALTQASGIHIFDVMLHGQAAHCYLSYGMPEPIEALLEKIAENMNPEHTLHASLYSYIGAWKLLVEERYEAARDLARIGMSQSLKGGAIFVPVIQNMIVLLIAEFMSGDRESARHHLSRILRLAEIMPVDYLRFVSSLLSAWVQLEESGEEACLETLASAMSIANRKELILYPGIPPKIMAALCAVALKHNFYPEHTKQIIRKLNLQPDQRIGRLSAWPWPVRILTMGDFIVEVDGKPLEFRRKLQQRPLALLKYLLSANSRRVTTEQAAAAIWPDAEGDQAHNALKSAVNRLRKLLGVEVVCLQGGYLWLNRGCCWADIWTLQELFGEFDALSGEDADATIEKIISLYHDNYLHGEYSPWVISQRENLRFHYGRALTRHTSRLLHEKKFEEVIRIAQIALEKLPCSETVCMNLMRSYIALGESHLAIQVYERCRSALAGKSDIEPGKEIQNLYEAITHY